MLLNSYRFGGGASSYALRNAILADGPTALWLLDETSGSLASDVSGNGLHGTYQTGATLGQAAYINGRPSMAAAATDANYVVTVEDHPLLQLGSNEFTLVIPFSCSISTRDRTLMSKERVGADYAEFAVAVRSNHKLQTYVNSSNGGGTGAFAESAANVDGGAFSLLIVERVNVGGMGTITTYLNGVSVSSFSFSGAIWDSSNKLTIGCSYVNAGSATQGLGGNVSHVALFNGAAIGSTRRAAYQAAFAA